MPPKPHTQPSKALLVSTTTTLVAPSYSSVILMLRSPMLAMLALSPDRWPSGSVVHTADELHMTVCYLGTAADLESRRPAVQAVVQAMAAQLPPIMGRVSGIGRFSSDDGMDAVYASFDAPPLAQWLVKLEEGLAAAGMPVDRRHGHDPHITLAYVPSGESVDLPPPWPLETAFTRVTLGWAGEYLDFDLSGTPWEMPGDVTDAAQVAADMATPAEDTPTEESADSAETASAAAGAEAKADGGMHAPAIWLAKDWKPIAPERKNDPESRRWKTVTHYTKDIDEATRTVVGVYSVFGNVDSYGDVVMPGSFAKTFRERAGRIHHIWQHDTTNPPIAIISSLQEVGRDALPADVQALYPDALGGAEVRRTYLEGPELANWVYEAILKGAPLEMSYMYDPLRYEYVMRDEERVCLLYEQRLWETSDVLWGANSATRASKARDLDLPPMSLDLLIGQLESALTRVQKAGARNSTDDLERINSIHGLVVKLGCTTCKGEYGDDDEPKAAPSRETTHASTGPTLDDARAAYHYLLLTTQEYL